MCDFNLFLRQSDFRIESTLGLATDSPRRPPRLDTLIELTTTMGERFMVSIRD